jgi:hypothetical protein
MKTTEAVFIAVIFFVLGMFLASALLMRSNHSKEVDCFGESIKNSLMSGNKMVDL